MTNEMTEAEKNLLRELHEMYPWTTFVPDEEWLAKIKKAVETKKAELHPDERKE